MPKPSTRTHYMEKDFDTFAMANKIELVRTSRDYSLEAMSGIVGISATQINKIEKHLTKNISKRLVQTYHEKFGIPLSELVVKRDKENKDYALWNWINDTQESMPYLQSAFYQYLRDKGKV